MGYSTTDGTPGKGLGSFNTTPTTASDFNKTLELVGRMGNLRVDTTAVRTALTGSHLFEGLHFYDTTLDTLFKYDGSGWVLVFQDWTAYTPTLTNHTLGNGTMEAKYQQAGGRVEFTIEYTWGSTSSVTGAVTFSLPLTPAASMVMNIGRGLFSDLSAGVTFPVDARAAGGSTVTAALLDHSVGTYSRPANLSNVIGTPANGDTLYLAGSYERA